MFSKRQQKEAIFQILFDSGDAVVTLMFDSGSAVVAFYSNLFKIISPLDWLAEALAGRFADKLEDVFRAVEFQLVDE